MRRTHEPIRRAAVASAVVLAAWLVDVAEARACETARVCFFWITEFTDTVSVDEDGEDYLIDPTVPARGARVTIIRPIPEEPISTTLDLDGCTSFETQHGYGHRATIHADSTIGGVRVRPGWGDYNVNNSLAVEANYPDYFFEVDLQGLTPDGETHALLYTTGDAGDPDFRNEVMPLYAAAVGIMSRLDDLGLLPATPPNPLTLSLAYLPTSGGARCNCDGDDHDIVDVGVGGQRLKFMLAHEIGHWLHAQYRGSLLDPLFYNYPLNALDPGSGDALEPGDAFDDPCRFSLESLSDDETMFETNADSHALRSAEWAGDAGAEAFAHFVSAIVHNDTSSEIGWYRYYKQLAGAQYDDLVQGDYLVELGENAAVGGENQWIINQCPNDREFDLEDQFPNDDFPDDGDKDDIAVELDWFRFWWRFATEQSNAPIPDSLEIVTFVGGSGWEDDELWPMLEGFIANQTNVLHDYEDRFLEIAEEEGIQNGS